MIDCELVAGFFLAIGIRNPLVIHQSLRERVSKSATTSTAGSNPSVPFAESTPASKHHWQFALDFRNQLAAGKFLSQSRASHWAIPQSRTKN